MFGVAANSYNLQIRPMLVLRRTNNHFGVIDGSQLNPELLNRLSLTELSAFPIHTDHGLAELRDLFEVIQGEPANEPLLVLVGDCGAVDGIGTGLQRGTICVLGSVGHSTAKEMQGGMLIVVGNAKDQLGCGMRDGTIYIMGDCGNQMGAPMPGRKSGMRGGDIIIAGSAGDRACERMRRGTVFVARSLGTHAASQMIAGTLVAMGDIGSEWGGGMRRGSIILGKDSLAESTATMSEPREFELSFLPLVWRHLEKLQNEALSVLNDVVEREEMRASGFKIPPPVQIPRTRWVQRQIADLNFDGRGEILVLRRMSSLGVV